MNVDQMMATANPPKGKSYNQIVKTYSDSATLSASQKMQLFAYTLEGTEEKYLNNLIFRAGLRRSANTSTRLGDLLGVYPSIVDRNGVRVSLGKFDNSPNGLLTFLNPIQLANESDFEVEVCTVGNPPTGVEFFWFLQLGISFESKRQH